MNGYPNYMSGVDIYQQLKEDILTLKLKPGQMISENEISRSYNVSRTPVKTAFLRLKGEKYIEIVPQKGSYVTLLDMKYIHDVIYMRYVLEADILKTIMESDARASLVNRLEQNLAEQKNLIDHAGLTPRSFYEIDSRFHFMMFEFVGRGKMWDVIQDCQIYYTRFRLLDVLTTARYKQLLSEHIRLCELIQDGDYEALKLHIYEHLHGNLRILNEKIEGEYKDYFVQY